MRTGKDSRLQRPPSLEPAVSRTASGGLSRNPDFQSKRNPPPFRRWMFSSECRSGPTAETADGTFDTRGSGWADPPQEPRSVVPHRDKRYSWSKSHREPRESRRRRQWPAPKAAQRWVATGGGARPATDGKTTRVLLSGAPKHDAEFLRLRSRQRRHVSSTRLDECTTCRLLGAAYDP